jgi:parallel beta-helix repeat protein/predicted outer membrane repeat protein
MKTKLILFLAIGIIIGFSINTFAQTSIVAGSVSGTWTKTGSPYLIQGNIQIADGSILSIEPGVSIIFQGAYKIKVMGQLLAIGTAFDSISFSASNTANGWKGIRFDNTSVNNDSSKIIYCKLQYGNATGTSPDYCGGALYFNNFSKAMISHSSISFCRAFRGAGIYFNNSSPIISGNNISYNFTDLDGGGAIYCDNLSNPNISNNIISNNSAKGPGAKGGGITCIGSPNIINNSIFNNSTDMSGGGINCDPSYGGTITDNIITNNTASFGGGGIYCQSIGNPKIVRNTISNNTAFKGGGFFFTSASNANLSENIICNNTASENGGGIYCEGSGIPAFMNSSIANNSSANGGALYCAGSSTPVFRNCIIYGNTASVGGTQVFLFDDASDPNFYYCDVQGSSEAFDLNENFYTGSYQNNINTDPLFVSPSGGSGNGFNGTTADWSLQSSSSCIDKGDPTFSPYPSIDKTGNQRITVCRIDIGAYEYQTGIPFAVSMTISQAIPCNGTTTGEVSAIATGGNTNYTYLWSNGQTTATATSLKAGTYTVTVSETSFGCSITKSITISQPLPTSVIASSDTIIICGSTAQLNAVTSPWALLNSGTTCTLNSVYFTDATTGYAVGGDAWSYGKILKTTNGGSDWTTQTLSSNSYLNSVYFTNTNTGYVVGTYGTILKTTNGGLTWNNQTSGITSTLYAVYFTSKDTGYAVGGNSYDSGTILKTTNGGSSWLPQTSGTTNNLYAVYFKDSYTGYAVGYNGTILKTTNGGLNWTAQNSGSTSNSLHSVVFLNENAGYATGTNTSMAMATILKTTDGGVNWNAQVFSSANEISSIVLINADTAYAVGESSGMSGKIFKTIDGGTNWSILSSGDPNALYSVYFTDSNRGYIVGGGGAVLKLTKPVAYSWSPSNTLNATNISNPVANPNVTTSYIVTTTTESNCIAKDTVKVIVNPLIIYPVMDKSIICGGSVKLDSIISNYNGSEFLSYLWSPASGLNFDTVPNPVATITNSTNFHIAVSTPNGCIAKDSVKVTVNPLNVNSGMDKTIICGGKVRFDNPVTNYTGSGTLAYSWLPKTGLDSAKLAQPTAENISDQTYILSVLTPNGCIAKDSVKVTVNPLNVNSGMDKTIICGGKVRFDNPVTNYTGSGTLVYSWLPETGLDSATLAQPTAEIISDQTYILSISTPNGCIAKDSVKVTVNPLTATANDIIVSCDNTRQLNVITNYSGSESLTYKWSPDSGLNDATIANPVDTLKVNAEYTVEVKTPNGCIANTNANVSASVISFIPSICMVTVNDSAKNVIVWQRENNAAIDSFFIYRESLTQTDQYDRIGAFPDSATGIFVDSASNARVQSNKYKIAVKDVCGFLTDMSSEHKTMHLTINKGIGNTWNLIWEQYIGVMVTNYGIYRGTTKSNMVKIGSSSGSNTTYTDETAPEGDVYYQIEVVLPQACANLKSSGFGSSRSNIISNADAVTGIIANSMTSMFIYPNPAFDKLNIINRQSSDAHILIIDLHGKQVLNKQICSDQLDISGLSNGIYIVKLVSTGNVLINKLVKE